jgi:ubiquinone/menaquinone biosynthesis C-methylase UbiE
VRHGIPVLVDLDNLPKHLVGQIRYFKSAAKTYRVKHSLTPWERKYVDQLEQHLGTYSGKVVVDDASGSGYIALEAAKRGATVLACDLNLTGLLHIRKVADSMGIGKRMFTVCCSAESLPVGSNVADAIAANAILEHLPEEQKAIADIGRIAKKGAIAMITVPLAYYYLNPLFVPINYFYDRKIGHLRRYTIEMLAKRFFGWKILQVTYSGHTRKVIKTLINLIASIFDESEIEDEEKRYASRKWFASNISVIFRKK